MLNKKTIGPVVATALLIVVAVVSVVGFQSWFGSFSSGIFTKTDTQSQNSLGNTQIDSVIGTIAYFNNAGTENISVTQVKIDGVDCEISTNISQGISQLDISSCIVNPRSSTPEVVIYTNKGVYSEKFYVKNPINCILNQNITPFNFTNQNNVNLSTIITSNTLTPTGYDGCVEVEITGDGNPQFSVNGGTFKTSTIITEGQTLTLRLTSSIGYGITHNATITIGNYTLNWSVTTNSSGEALFNTSGNYTWPVPLGVTNISVVCVAAGGGGGSSGTGVNATSGGNSSISNLNGTIYSKVTGGKNGTLSAIAGALGANGGVLLIGDGGANGSNSPTRTQNWYGCGGGGAGLMNGSKAPNGTEDYWGGSGGSGANIFNSGIGSAGGPSSPGDENIQNGIGGQYGGGGAAGRDGMGGGGGAIGYTNNIIVNSSTTLVIEVGASGIGKNYGNVDRRGANGGSGACRIIWGPGRSFPNNSS